MDPGMQPLPGICSDLTDLKVKTVEGLEGTVKELCQGTNDAFAYLVQFPTAHTEQHWNQDQTAEGIIRYRCDTESLEPAEKLELLNTIPRDHTGDWILGCRLSKMCKDLRDKCKDSWMMKFLIEDGDWIDGVETGDPRTILNFDLGGVARIMRAYFASFGIDVLAYHKHGLELYLPRRVRHSSKCELITISDDSSEWHKYLLGQRTARVKEGQAVTQGDLLCIYTGDVFLGTEVSFLDSRDAGLMEDYNLTHKTQLGNYLDDQELVKDFEATMEDLDLGQDFEVTTCSLDKIYDVSLGKFINDPAINPGDEFPRAETVTERMKQILDFHKEYSESARDQNCDVVHFILSGVQFKAIFATEDISGGKDLKWSYGPRFWLRKKFSRELFRGVFPES